MNTHYPLLYQCNIRVLLTSLSRSLGRVATLDDVPESVIENWASRGFDWIWLLSVWQIGEDSRTVSRSHPELRHEFKATLPDLKEEDIDGSGFAITAYHVHQGLGGDAALARLRQRFAKHGLKLMLDFVPNHMGLGHPWIDLHPDYFVSGTEEDLVREPNNYVRVQTASGPRINAYGRDPYFSGWSDTLQVNYANADARQAMQKELLRIAKQCDGVRCDMAMLVLPEVFERTWGRSSEPFWPTAIEAVKKENPTFHFMAEVYWDMEWTLQQQGFDTTYDKRLYDRLRAGQARPVREHLQAGLEYQSRLARFLENHDEQRAATAFSWDEHQAAAILTYLTPGLRFFHAGQLEGNRMRISPHLVRGPYEPVDAAIASFYKRLLAILREPTWRTGRWQLLETIPAWDGNWTNDSFIAFAWLGTDDQRYVVAVNYSDHPSQCHVQLPLLGLESGTWKLVDRLSEDRYTWNGEDLTTKGLYLDEPAWRARVFELIVDHE
jgi:hypothetical protein